MKAILQQLTAHKTLSKSAAQQAITNIAHGNYNDAQIAAFMTVYLMRNITVEELQGFRKGMLELCIPVDLSEYDTMDLCGTGGDGKNTFNISTLSSFVVAAAGQQVAKHGNYGVSSVSGSSNVLAHFGYRFTADPDQIRRSLDRCGICFLHAPLFHPALKHVGNIRRELGVKTFFNMLGPMVNPSFPNKQIVGVYSLELARLYGYLYQKTNKHYSIIHSLDGYDEISLTCPFKRISNTCEEVLEPETLGFTRHPESALFGGNNIAEAAQIFENILKGKGSRAQNEVVIANAAEALVCGKNLPYAEAKNRAAETLESGRGLDTFKKLLNQ